MFRHRLPAAVNDDHCRLWQSTHGASLSLCEFFVPSLRAPNGKLQAASQPRCKLESAKFCSVSCVIYEFHAVLKRLYLSLSLTMLYLISCNYLGGLRIAESYVIKTAIYQIVIVNYGLILLFLLHFINLQQ